MTQLMLGDCLEEMKNIPDGSVDMILCDLPYGTTRNKWDSVIPLQPLWEQYWRILKNNGIIALTGSQPFSSMLVMSQPEMFRHEWIWVKNKGSNYLNAKREPMKEHEQVLIFSQGKWVYNRVLEERSELGKQRHKYGYKSEKIQSDNYGKQPQLTYSIDKDLRVPKSYQRFIGEHGLHPTQKPVALMEYLIKTYTNQGDTVLDNCFGSCTTGIACINTNRRFIGIEKDSVYFEIGKKRIENTPLPLIVVD